MKFNFPFYVGSMWTFCTSTHKLKIIKNVVYLQIACSYLHDVSYQYVGRLDFPTSFCCIVVLRPR